MRVAGDENLRRTRARLERSARARAALRRLGVTELAERRLMLGLKEPYESRDGVVVEDALAFPILGDDGMPRGRYGFASLPGVTRNAPGGTRSWGVGRPLSYWSGLTSPALPLVVCADPLTLWLASQLLDGRPAPDFNLLTWSHGDELPLEWADERFWSRWSSVTVLADEGMDRVAGLVATAHPRGVATAAPPSGHESWAAALAAGLSEADLSRRIQEASPWIPPDVGSDGRDAVAGVVGEFPARPVHVATAFVDGNLFYPYLVEERIEEAGPGASRRLVHRYGVRVLRSDGEVLKIAELPAARGVGKADRVLALSDGTRVASIPHVSRHASWSFPSISLYVASRGRPGATHRPLDILLSDVEAYVWDCVWLPHADDALVAALYILLSHVFQVFNAVPLLHICGPKGSGKSELGQAIADLGCNGVVVGQASAAGLVRLMHEARGLVVLDDLERIGVATGAFGEIAQLLKQSYKRGSAAKQLVDQSGRVEEMEFFGPKVVSNTRGADAVLASRMLTIVTEAVTSANAASVAGGDPDRAASIRDELHCWGMANASLVAEATRSRSQPVSRREEIEAPLRTLAAMCGADVSARLGSVLARQSGVAPRDLRERLRQALAAALGGTAAAEIAMPQLQLELALTSGGAETAAPSPETIGRTLASMGVRLAGAEGRRERLHGSVCRVLALDVPSLVAGGMAPVATASDPMAFCRGRACGTCRYVAVCGSVAPALFAAKRRSR